MKSALVPRFVVVSLLSATIGLAGCGKGGGSGASASAEASGASVKDQCAALTKANDTWSDKLTKQKDTNDAAKDAQTMAKSVEDWAAAVGKLGVDDPDLKKLVTEEQSVLTGMSASVKELATILAKLDDKKAPGMDEKALAALQQQMDALEKKQDASQKAADAIDEKIAKYCEGK